MIWYYTEKSQKMLQKAPRNNKLVIWKAIKQEEILSYMLALRDSFYVWAIKKSKKIHLATKDRQAQSISATMQEFTVYIKICK